MKKISNPTLENIFMLFSIDVLMLVILISLFFTSFDNFIVYIISIIIKIILLIEIIVYAGKIGSMLENFFLKYGILKNNDKDNKII